jgi:hypothetical protein
VPVRQHDDQHSILSVQIAVSTTLLLPNWNGYIHYRNDLKDHRLFQLALRGPHVHLLGIKYIYMLLPEQDFQHFLENKDPGKASSENRCLADRF